MRGTGARVGLVVALLGLALGGQTVVMATPAAAAATCGSYAGSGYNVAVCLDPLLDGATLTGTRQVTASVTVTPPGAVTVDRVTFSWNDGYLLADHDPDLGTATYRMTLRSERLASGSASPAGGTLSARATVVEPGTLMQRTTNPDTVAVTVSNAGAIEPPPAFDATTAGPGPDGRVRLAAVGDGADGSPASVQVADLVQSWHPDVFAYLGDVYDNGTSYEFDTWYGDANGYGRFRAITNPTVGNHEMRTDLAAPYFAFWGGVPHFYSYDLAGWHVVVLDSTTEFEPIGGQEQYDWLASDLTAHAGACTLAYMHHPRYSSVAGVGRTGFSDEWALMADRGVSMVLAGHAHTYERWTPLNRDGAVDPTGMTQVIAGTGGREILNNKVPEPRVAAQVTAPGALLLELGADDAALTFSTVDGQFVDRATVPCRHPAPPPPPLPPPDTTAPTTPAGVAARAASPTSADVFWTAASDAVGVTGYTVRRDGAVVASLPAGATTYRDPALTAEHAYAWTVDAFDAAGNRSAVSAAATATTPFVRVGSRTLLAALRRAPERDRGFTASDFPGWRDADHDGCSTASEVLVAEALRPPRIGAGCALTGGRWRSPYDGRYRTRTGALVVDHLVPLREAWRSGARQWRAAQRRRLVNDLGYPATLVAVTKASATAKAGREPQDWLPRPSYRCTYAADWVAVKWRWRLAVDPVELRFLTRTLRGCGWPQVRAPGRAAG